MAAESDDIETEIKEPESEDAEAQPADGESGMDEIPERTKAEYAVMAVCAIAVVLSIVEVVFNQSKLVILGAILGLVVAPVAIKQQRDMTEIIEMKKTYEAAVAEIGRFKEENNRLGKNVEDLDDTVGRLEDMETALDVITQTQGQSLEEFEEQVKENEDILNSMLKSLRANVRQNLLTVIYSSDTDGDARIDGPEVDDLVDRIHGINGVTLHEEALRSAIAEGGGSLLSVLTLVKKMVTNEETTNDIFVVGELTP